MFRIFSYLFFADLSASFPRKSVKKAARKVTNGRTEGNWKTLWGCRNGAEIFRILILFLQIAEGFTLPLHVERKSFVGLREQSSIFCSPTKDFSSPPTPLLIILPANFPTDFLGKLAEIANGDQMTVGCLATVINACQLPNARNDHGGLLHFTMGNILMRYKAAVKPWMVIKWSVISRGLPEGEAATVLFSGGHLGVNGEEQISVQSWQNWTAGIRSRMF